MSARERNTTANHIPLYRPSSLPSTPPASKPDTTSSLRLTLTRTIFFLLIFALDTVFSLFAEAIDARFSSPSTIFILRPGTIIRGLAYALCDKLLAWSVDPPVRMPEKFLLFGVGAPFLAGLVRGRWF